MKKPGINEALLIRTTSLEIYTVHKAIPEALKNYFAALKSMRKWGDKKSLAYTYDNIGGIYLVQGNNPEALKNYSAALKIRDKPGTKKTLLYPTVTSEVFIRLKAIMLKH